MLKSDFTEMKTERRRTNIKRFFFVNVEPRRCVAIITFSVPHMYRHERCQKKLLKMNFKWKFMELYGHTNNRLIIYVVSFFGDH